MMSCLSSRGRKMTYTAEWIPPYVSNAGNSEKDILLEDANAEKSSDQHRANTLRTAFVIFDLLFICSPLTSGADAVVCKECDTTIEDERDIEKILDIHDAKSPSCKLPREKYNNYNRKRNDHVQLKENVTTDGSSDNEEMYEGESGGQHVTTSSATGYGGGVYHPTNARYQQYLNRIERTLSLGKWGNPFRFNPAEAAEAGLFYPGSGSDLLCHYCGVSVPPLNKSDDAWIEHARLGPGCGFVKFMKSEGFIRIVQEMYDDCDIEDSVLDQELASMEQDQSMRFRESQLAPELPTRGATAAVSSSSSSQSTNGYKPQPNTSNSHSSYPTTSTLPQRMPQLPRVEPVARPIRPPRIPKRQVQAREVRARLDMEWAQKLITMGYSADLVGAVIAEQMIYNGDDFKSFKDMLMATVEAADMGDSYPVRHYALGLAQNTAMSSASEGSSTSHQPPPATPRSGSSSFTTPSSRSTSNSAMALSVGASSWTETTPSVGNEGNNPAINNIETSVGNLTLESQILEKENRELKEKKMCKICYERDANIVFLPCGHLVVCENCNIRLNECPLCRRRIQGTLKTYLS